MNQSPHTFFVPFGVNVMLVVIFKMSGSNRYLDDYGEPVDYVNNTKNNFL
jgi:hypothetical protein